jgi:hypothetical protein
MRQERKVAIWKRDNFKCYYCGVDCRAHPTIDHVIPKVKGGSSEYHNLVTACYDCNHGKADTLPQADKGTCIVKRAWQIKKTGITVIDIKKLSYTGGNVTARYTP